MEDIMNYTNESDARNKATQDYYWFINSSEIVPGGSAVIGDNWLAFYAIHHLALCLITISFVASCAVIINTIPKLRRNSRTLQIHIRFPLYLAIAEIFWGCSHFADHLYLVTVQTYPTSYVVRQILCINMAFFFGYQQLMHATVAAYTYFCVVHRKTISLGKWEWKVHLSWFSLLTCLGVTFGLMKSFGNSGYWLAYDSTTVHGQILGFTSAILSTFNAICTTLGYLAIKRTVSKSRKKLQAHTHSGINNYHQNNSSRDNSSIALERLTTFVWVAGCLYCPLALLLWISLLFQVILGTVEPLSCFFIAIVANSSGWANAYGYFHNKKVKWELKQTRLAQNLLKNAELRNFESITSSQSM